jgi:GTP cyclohydrolase I
MADNVVSKITENMENILDLLEIPRIEGSKSTAQRVAMMWANEMLVNRNNRNIAELNNQMALFSSPARSLIVIKDIEFWSTCEHHLLPFGGKCSVAYIPDGEIVGLSKIPRVVKFFCKKPQIQERLTKEIGEYLVEKISPLFLIVRMEATHTCVACRGAESSCQTDTIYKYIVEGQDDFALMFDFYSRIRGVSNGSK